MAIPAALPPLPFNPTRVRSYVLRLPLFTRLVLLIILAFWLLELQTIWSVVQWGSLTPNEIGIGSMYRLNTYPFIHVGFFHAFVNLLALTPLLERFEAEHGTLTAVALFIGRKSSQFGVRNCRKALPNRPRACSGLISIRSSLNLPCRYIHPD
jgi:glycosylphosphatidylinositol transamidase